MDPAGPCPQLDSNKALHMSCGVLPKISLKTSAPLMKFGLPLQKSFLLWVSGWVSWGWPGPQTTPCRGSLLWGTGSKWRTALPQP